MEKTPNGSANAMTDNSNTSNNNSNRPMPAITAKDTPQTSQTSYASSQKPEPKPQESLLDQATHAAKDVMGQAKGQLDTQLKTQKDETASRLGNVASALRESGKKLGEGQGKDSALPSYANQAADQVERLTSYVRSRTIGDLLGDVEGFARREPALFIGGSFALGLVAARFLKSSAHRESAVAEDERPTYPGTKV